MDLSPERKEYIKQVALGCFLFTDTATLPVDIIGMIKRYPANRLIPYTHVMKKENKTFSQVLADFGNRDAFTCRVRKGNKILNFIFYNDYSVDLISSNRYRFSLAHELGHVLIGHLNDSNTAVNDKESLSKYEAEADYFAQLILVPHAGICGFNIKKAKDIEIICKISSQAANRRFKEYKSWLKNISADDNYDQNIFDIFQDYMFKRKCKVCNGINIQRYGKFCIYCGNKNTLEWSKEKMIYPKMKTYENNKLETCPRCQNEETNIDGSYCQICGLLLINTCSDNFCNAPLSSNARFCNLCGNNSIFFNSGILKKWNEASLEPVSFEIDEEIWPFE